MNDNTTLDRRNLLLASTTLAAASALGTGARRVPSVAHAQDLNPRPCRLRRSGRERCRPDQTPA